MSVSGVCFLSLHVRRWVLFLAATLVIQLSAALLAPQFICACSRPQLVPLVITLVPLLWAIVLVVIYNGWEQRVVAWAALCIALASVSG